MRSNLSRVTQQQNQRGKFARRPQPQIFAFLSAITMMSGLAGAATGVVLHSFPFKNSKSAIHVSASSDDINSPIPGVLSRPINILILGIDNAGHPHSDHFTDQEAFAGNSDTMLLVRIEPDLHQVTVLSIPRDTLVQIPNIGTDKINDANVQGGVTLAATTVSQLLNGLPIDRYIRLNTEGFIHLVDAIDGLDITVPKAMDYVDHTQHLAIHFAPGYQKLNGQHLQEYIRYRHDELGDIGRVQRQQGVLKALLQKIIQPATITKLPQLLQVAQENVDTDLSIGEMLSIGRSLAEVDRQHVNLILLPGRFSRPDEYQLSYWIFDAQATAPILTRYFQDVSSSSQPNESSSTLP